MREEFHNEFSKLVNWHWWYVGRKKIIIGLLEKYCNSNNLKILDLGCGPGGMLKDIYKFGGVYGIDLNLKAINICREKGYRNTCIAQGENIPFKSSNFSIVSMLDLLEHINDERAVIKEALRVSEPGGLIILTVPAFEFLWSNMDIICHHKRRYTKKSLKKLLPVDRPSVLRMSYYNFLLFPIITIVRFFEKIKSFFYKGSAKINSDFNLNKPGVVNNILTAIFSSELKVLRFFSMPFGISIVCIIKKTK